MDLPQHAITQAQAEKLWAVDRRSLVICKDRHTGFLRFFEKLAAGLEGKKR